ncbi:MAG: hypothetical protein ACLFQY_19965, partial [Desulfococcaceae bacterium]
MIEFPNRLANPPTIRYTPLPDTNRESRNLLRNPLMTSEKITFRVACAECGKPFIVRFELVD